MSPAARVAWVSLTVLLYVLPRTSVADKVKIEVDNKVLRAERLLAEVKGSASDSEKADKRREALKLFTASIDLIEKYGDPERPTIRLHAGTLALLLGENDLARAYCSRAMDQFGPSSTLYKVAERCVRDAALPPSALTSCPPPPVCPPLPDPVSCPPPVCPPVAEPSQVGASPALPRIAPQQVQDCQRLAGRYPSQGQDCYRQLLSWALAPETPSATVQSLAWQLSKPATQVPRRGRTDRGSALVSAGLTLWLGALVPPMVFGPLYMNGQSFSNRFDASGLPTGLYGTLMIPLVGPFISGIWFASEPGIPPTAWQHYSLPWMLADGAAQVIGFSLLIAGVSHRSSGSASWSSWSIAPELSSTNRGLVFSSRF